MTDWSIVAVTIALRVFLRIYDIISFPFYVVLQQPWTRASKRLRAKPVDSNDKEITYRTIDEPGKIYIRMLQAHVDTLEKMFKAVTKIHKTKRCLGTREILAEEDEVQPNGKVFKKLRLGEYRWRNYLEAEQEARYFGRGMRELGIQPHDKVVMFAETRAEWMIAAHGLFKQSCTIVTIYATLGDEGVTHGVTETEVKTLITSQELLPKIRNLLKTIPNVDTIVFFEDQLQKADTSGFGDVRVVPYKRVVENGADSNFEEVPPSTNDIAFIMYTSGSTGNPKGVLLSHQNCIATMECYCDVPLSPDDVGIGFLPLAHVFELLAESVALLRGIPIGYSSPNTLLDNSSKVMRGCQGDANVLQPSVMTIVPLILDRISKTIDEKLNKATPMQKAIFNVAYRYKIRKLRRGFSTPILDHFIFKKMARVMGGRLRVMLSGGAPLSPETHDKCRVVLCCAVAQGYGLTETTAGATITSVRDTSTGRVGAPSALVDIKLVNWEEGNYRVTNKPYPQGEVVIGGETVSPGYYKLPGKTAEDFYDEDDKRWFRTGDIGEMHPDGVLKIIDRKKDLVKLQAGEYVSLGKVEAALKTCQLVENVCVYAESSKHFCIALVLPNPKALLALADSLGIKGELEDLCTNPDINKAVLKALHDQAKKSALQRFEIPEKIALCSDVWSPNNGLLTAAFKIKRRELQLKYQDEINKLYSA